jgi:hypothetical protein
MSCAAQNGLWLRAFVLEAVGTLGTFETSGLFPRFLLHLGVVEATPTGVDGGHFPEPPPHS